MIKEFISYWNPLIIIFILLFFLTSWNSQNKFILFLLKHFKIFFIALVFPIILMSLLYIFNNKNIGSTSDWFVFLGGYFGVIGVIGGIWWQLNEEKRKQQLGSLKIIEHYLTILSYRFKRTALTSDKKRIGYYKYFFSNNLFIDTGLLGNTKEHFIISKKDIQILKSNIKNISSLDSYINIFKIIDNLEHIIKILSNIHAKNKFPKIFEEIVIKLNLEKSDIILILKTRLALSYHKNLIPSIFQSKLSHYEIDEILKTVKNISSFEELHSVILDINKIISISSALETNMVKSELYKIIFHLLDIGEVLWGNLEAPEIYTFETLETEINNNLSIIQKEIKKLS